MLRRALMQEGRRTMAKLPLERRRGSKLVAHLGLLRKQIEVCMHMHMHMHVDAHLGLLRKQIEVCICICM